MCIRDRLWGELQKLQKAEREKGGVLDMDTDIVSSLTSHKPGYISESLKEKEQIVGLQTDKPLKRAFMPFGGIRTAEEACTTYEMCIRDRRLPVLFHPHLKIWCKLLPVLLHTLKLCYFY